MFNPDDLVEVLNSKRGYKGPGVLVDLAYSGHYLVRIPTSPKPTVIVVRFQDLRKAPANTNSKTKSK